MKLFISSDIEGTCGICNWDETQKGHPDYEYFAKQMSKEVAAVCSAALESGKIEDILIKDAHGTARNICPELLPEGVKLHRGWQGVPGAMMAGVEKGFDAVAMTGYHSAAYTEGNPLSHTTNLANQYVKINGNIASEFMINAYQAAYYGVPVILVSGDQALCDQAHDVCPHIETACVSEGCGGASISIHPRTALNLLRQKMKEALGKDLSCYKIELPKHFHVEIEFKEFVKAQRSSFYPGAKREGTKCISFDADDYYEVLRFLFFVL